MVRWFLLGIVSFPVLNPPPARACEPEDAFVLLEPVSDGFVFVTRSTLVRVDTRGRVTHARDIGFTSGARMSADGRTLVRAYAVGEGMSCMAQRFRIERLDTTRAAAASRAGTFPRGPLMGTTLMGMRRVDGAVHISLRAYSVADDGDEDVLWDVAVPTAGRARATRRDLPNQLPGSREASGETAALELARTDTLRFLLPSDRPSTATIVGHGHRVSLTMARDVIAAAFSADGRRVAIASWEVVNEDYGTGFDARLDVLDLADGTVQTPRGTTGIARVDGRIPFACDWRVEDPGSQLNVRASPRGRASIVHRLPHGTAVSVAPERRGRWRRLTAPVDGWVFAERVVEHCTPQ